MAHFVIVTGLVCGWFFKGFVCFIRPALVPNDEDTP